MKNVLSFRLSMVCITILAVMVSVPVSAQSFTEEFVDITTLSGSGWFAQNNSDDAANATTNWGPITPGVMAPRSEGRFQGNDGVFPAYSGGVTEYIGDNYNATTGAQTISDWLMTPTVTIQNGDTISFWTRTGDGSSYPDRLELRMSLNGSSTDCGTLSTDVGDFSTVLVEINPSLTVGGYPETWTQYSATISGVAAPTSGRFAFRYFVTDAGPSGTNSNYIGLDLVEYNSAPVELQSFVVE
jgi:hypothetical protein